MSENGFAVVFDASTGEYLALPNKETLDDAPEGTVFDFEGRTVEVAALCGSILEARLLSSDLQANLMNGQRAERSKSVEILNVDTSDSTTELRDPSNEESDLNSVRTLSYIGEGTPESRHDQEDPTYDRYRQESIEPPINFDSVGVVRDVLQNLLSEMSDDVSRINRRFQEIRQILVRYYGTTPDGAVVNNFDEFPETLALVGDLSPSRSLLTKRDHSVRYVPRPNYFDKLVLLERKKKAAKRAFDADEYMDDQPPRKRDFGRAGSVLTHPFLDEEIEERIFYEAQGSFAVYAQKLSKELFADTLHLYFKDQCSKKRNWFHEAVDYRFPSEDRAAHLQKWKNCSYYINKNMTTATKKDKPVSKAEINYKYLNAAIEKSCHDKSNKDPIKYAELMALYLFSDSLQKFFKEQDPKRKDWLRHCVDTRFPMNDKLKRDQRWKVCAVACNRNRTKVVNSDGSETQYPYFPKEYEEESFRSSSGSAAVYCELICERLFPESQHLFFKDRDLGKRNWLHDLLDSRFPTPDKTAHIAKWKNCTSNINKNVPAAQLELEKRQEKKNNPKVKSDTKPKYPTELIVPSSSASSGERSSSRSSKRAQKGEMIPNFPPEMNINEDEEQECWDFSKGNIQVYARNIGRAVFKDSLKLSFKDQDESKKKWIQETIQYRFPNTNVEPESRQWRVVVASINKNASLR
ncbi:unnamed protein product [Auanema sp. JU1783]|nr:unnamed protein product [Auanema sp. JU1783]